METQNSTNTTLPEPKLYSQSSSEMALADYRHYPAPIYKDPTIRVKNLPSTKKLKGIMTRYLLKAKLNHLLPWTHSAWVAAGFPVELCYALDIFPLHPENSACISGARKVSQKLIESAESLGFSQDLCSYFKTNIGAVHQKVSASLGGIDKPSFMVSTNTICDTHVKWFQTQARRMGVPYFGFDIPSAVDGITDERIEEDYVEYVVEQFYDFFDFVYEHTGKKLRPKKYFRVLYKSAQLSALWREIYRYRAEIPTPVAFQDTLAAIFPLVLLPGLSVGIKYYRSLLRDIKQRVKLHEGAVYKEQEKFRLLFEGIPMWYRIKFFHQIAHYGGIVTFEPYTFSFAPEKHINLSFEESLREAARSMILIPYSYSLERRIRYFEEIIARYHIDGVILHANRSCRPSVTGMVDLKKAIQEDMAVPVLLVDTDMNDPRAFAQEAIRTRLEGFMEVLASSKAQREF